MVIHVSEGAWVKLQDMPLPPKLASRTVDGKVLYPDGNLATDAEVAFEMSEYPYGSKAVCRTALDGRFSMTLLDGLKYSVRAVGMGPRSGKPLRSDPVGFPSRGDATDLTVVLSHPVEPSNLLQNPDGSLGILHWTMKKSGPFEPIPDTAYFFYPPEFRLRFDAYRRRTMADPLSPVLRWLCGRRSLFIRSLSPPALTTLKASRKPLFLISTWFASYPPKRPTPCRPR